MRSGYASSVPPSARIFTDARKDNPLPPAKRADEIQSIVARDLGRGVLRTIDPGRHGDLPGCVGADAHHDRLRGMAREHFARVAHRSDAIRQPRDGAVDVELEPVVGRACLRARTSRRRSPSDWYDSSLNGLPHRVFLGNRIGLDGHAREQQTPHLGKVFRSHPGCSCRAARPSTTSSRSAGCARR